jgi:glycine/D-amino acid oxidase-like deaminating enzyme
MFSYWQRSVWFQKTDVAVIGSGIVGLTAAIHLKIKNPVLRVTLFEKGPVPSGATSKNAGFATFGSISEISDDLSRHDSEAVFSLANKRIQGLYALRNLLSDDLIRYEASGGYEIFRTEEEYSFYSGKIAEINALFEEYTGLKNVYSIPDENAGYFGFKNVAGLIFNQYEGLLNSGSLIKVLTEKARSLEVEIFNGFELSRFESDSNGVDLFFKTPDVQIQSGKLLICTNGFTGQILSGLDVNPARGLVLVTSPIKNLKLKGGFHHNKGYDYFREIDGRVLLGGGRNLDIEGETTTQESINPKIHSYLVSLLREVILPDSAFTIEYEWTGVMGVGKTKKPIVQNIQPNVFCAVRMGGMGVALGALTGNEAADLILSQN